MKIFENAGVFFATYVLVMLPTYVLPYFGSNSLLAQGAGIAARSNELGGGAIGGLFLMHLGCLAVLALITWVRGSSTGRSWVVVFPALAAVFDLTPGLNIIPLVPTLMHVLAMVLGVRGTPTVIVAGTSPQSNQKE